MEIEQRNGHHGKRSNDRNGQVSKLAGSVAKCKFLKSHCNTQGIS